MNQYRRSIITGTGSYIPPRRVLNEDFLNREFYETDGTRVNKPIEEILEKFKAITTIEERRYISDDLVTSDIAYFAAEKAIESAGIDKESLDAIIVSHNFGDVKKDRYNLDVVPCLASRVKSRMGVENPDTVAHDICFGCPGWLQAMIHADVLIRAGEGDKILVIGSETLSRVSDPHDRDSMLYADGAGACVLESRGGSEEKGFLASKSRSDSMEFSNMLSMGPSNNPDLDKGSVFLKMNGRKLYQYALERVPKAIGACLDESGVPLERIKKVLIHQANGKMDDAILERLYHLHGVELDPKQIMPMTVNRLGNSSVATLPTLYDLLCRGEMDGHTISKGDPVVFASVGAGMNINAMVYKA